MHILKKKDKTSLKVSSLKVEVVIGCFSFQELEKVEIIP